MQLIIHDDFTNVIKKKIKMNIADKKLRKFID